jgi:DNA-binding NtrC family response regulator
VRRPAGAAGAQRGHPLLVASFLEKFSGAQTPPREISEDAKRRLMAYDWPGNVRELENATERAVAMGSGPIVSVADLPSNVQYSTAEHVPMKDELLPLGELERRAILRMLGIGKTTLYRKLQQYHMERAEALCMASDIGCLAFERSVSY